VLESLLFSIAVKWLKHGKQWDVGGPITGSASPTARKKANSSGSTVPLCAIGSSIEESRTTGVAERTVSFLVGEKEAVGMTFPVITNIAYCARPSRQRSARKPGSHVAGALAMDSDA